MRSMSSPSLLLSISGLAYLLSSTPFRVGFSFSISIMASSMYCPILMSFALSMIKPHLASFGTQKMFSDSYSSLSSSNPSPSAISASYFVSNLSDMYFRNISPSTTCLYSLASILPLSLSAAFQSVSSNPMFPVVAIVFPPWFMINYCVCYIYEGFNSKGVEFDPFKICINN